METQLLGFQHKRFLQSNPELENSAFFTKMTAESEKRATWNLNRFSRRKQNAAAELNSSLSSKHSVRFSPLLPQSFGSKLQSMSRRAKLRER